MLKLRIREYTPMGVKGRILPAIGINYGAQLNGEPTLEFSLSWAEDERLDSPYVVRVEYSTGGAFKPLPNNDFFVMFKDSGDDADAAEMVRYTGRGYLTWLMAKSYIHWSSSAKNNERTITGNAGYLMRAMFQEAKGRGWGSQFSYSFTNTTDSSGAAWTSDDSFSQAWRLLTPLSDMLDQLVESELADWSTNGLTFQLFRPTTLGSDKSEIVIGGPRVERVPVEVDTTDIFTNLTVVPEKASNWLYLSNDGKPGNVTKFGRLEATMTQAGVSSHAEATKLAESTMKKGRTIVRQESFEWTPSDTGDLVPWDDFNIGDMVTTRVRGGEQIRRVVGLVVNEQNGATTIRIVAGEKAKTSGARIKDRLKSVAVGDYVGGGGGGFPAVPTPALAPPAKPLGLVVISNGAYWQGSTARATVGLDWADVTAADDGSEIDILGYEVWSRLPGEERSVNASTNVSTILVETWAPGVERLVSVRAQSTNGDWGEFSDEIIVVPATPTALTPKAPGIPVVDSNVGNFTSVGAQATVSLSWAPTTEATDGTPVEVVSYTVYTDNLAIGSSSVPSITLTIPSGVTRSIRVVATSSVGVSSDPSEAIDVTGAAPTLTPRVPSTPVLSSSFGVVIATWDGTATPAFSINGFTVAVQGRKAGDTTWIPQGSRLEGPGTQSVQVGEVGDTVEVRFVLYDPLNREVGVSTTASIVVSGVTIPDISEELENWIIANSGSHVHVGPTEPTTARENDLWFVTNVDGDFENIKIYNGTGFVLYSLIADSILVANSVTGRTLNVTDIWADTAWLNEVSAGVINADQINPIGEKLNIYANEAVQIIVGTQESQGVDIQTAQDTANDAANDAAAAAAAAAAARQTAISAESAALVAQTLAESVDAVLQEYQTVYIIDEFGAVIASIDNTNKLMMRSNYIAMVQNGLEVTRWEGNRMIVREIVVQEARIGNHQFTTYNPAGLPKHTIVRPIS